MRTMSLSVFLVIALCSVSALGSPMEQRVTLYSPIRYGHDWSRAYFNFEQGVRGNADKQLTGDVWDVLYGNFKINNNADWFSLARRNHRSRIRDLGALNWQDISQIPILPARPEPLRTITVDASANATTNSPDGNFVRAIVGHVYLAHIKDDNSDFYAMFRVEEMVPGDNVTISWRLVPSPEQ